MEAPVGANRICPITPVDMRCNNESPAEHAKVIARHFVALGLHEVTVHRENVA
jgi:hypothetical protein